MSTAHIVMDASAGSVGGWHGYRRVAVLEVERDEDGNLARWQLPAPLPKN